MATPVPMTSLRPLPPPPPLPAGSLTIGAGPGGEQGGGGWRGRAAGRRAEVNYMTGARVPTNRWENRAPQGDPPRPRSGHTFLCHHDRDIAVLFGGLGDDTAQTGEDPVLNDAWLYHIEKEIWQELRCTGEAPPGVFGHTAELLTRSAQELSMITYGGQTAGGLLTGEIHLLCDIYGACTWRRIAACDGPQPSALSRWGHSSTALWESPGDISAVTGQPVPSDGNVQLIVCGGMGEAFRSLDDVIAFDVGAMRWYTLSAGREQEQQEVDDKRPIGRRRHVTALGPDGRMWLFGGRSGWNSFHNDLWAFDIGTRSWSRVPLPRQPGRWPLPRTGHCGALVAGQLYVFGGFELRKGTVDEWEYMLYDDLWRFSLQERQWEPLTPEDAASDLVTIGGAYGGHAGDASVAARRADSVRVREESLKPDAALPDVTSPPRSGRKRSCPTAGPEVVPVCCHTCSDRTTPCRCPRQRSMAASFVHNGRLYLHGGRDKNQAFECFFSLPLSGGAKSTLAEFVAQRIADLGVVYWDSELPPELTGYLDTLFKGGDTRRIIAPGQRDLGGDRQTEVEEDGERAECSS